MERRRGVGEPVPVGAQRQPLGELGPGLGAQLAFGVGGDDAARVVQVDIAHRMIQATSADLPMPWPEATATLTASSGDARPWPSFSRTSRCHGSGPFSSASAVPGFPQGKADRTKPSGSRRNEARDWRAAGRAMIGTINRRWHCALLRRRHLAAPPRQARHPQGSSFSRQLWRRRLRSQKMQAWVSGGYCTTLEIVRSSPRCNTLRSTGWL